jgi:hypothetical protein
MRYGTQVLPNTRRLSGVTNIRGIVTFPTLAAAIKAGFQVYDRTPEGYLVRIRTAKGWAFALVALRN